MKHFNILLVFLIVLSACKNKQEINGNSHSQKNIKDYINFGSKITSENASGTIEIFEAYKQLQITDTLSAKFKGKVISVCKAKGCWMEIELAEGQNVTVRFKDYSFFVPKDIEGKTAVVDGIGYLKQMSVEEQKHYADDAMANTDEITSILNSKKVYEFVADGVLLTE
ncbi:MAG: DUF4920 domain-containing protein [Eudoraea sp.]|uniref:DUF4920 domain-containing protein n=1 Tax=Eudoraea sp. TaxID=1979955 RepID=UPI003C73CDB3